VIAQVVPLLEHHLMVALDAGLGRGVMGHPGRERLINRDRHVTGQAARPFVVALAPHEVWVPIARWLLLLGLLLRRSAARRERKAHQWQYSPQPSS
jgi:hypothetical protein